MTGQSNDPSGSAGAEEGRVQPRRNGNTGGNNTDGHTHSNRQGDGGAERAPPSGILKKQNKGQAKTVQLATSPGETIHIMEAKKMAAEAAYRREEENTYKSVYEVPQNAEPNFFNCDTVPWVSSFFSLKEEDFAIFGNTLRRRNIFKRCFQRIHKNRRRRCMSFNPYRVPLACKKVTLEEMLISEPKMKKKNKKRKKKKNPMLHHRHFYKRFILRGGKKNWLETHPYHSRRFHMASIYGYKLPLKNCSKISRRIFRYSKRKSLIHDMSYVEIIQLTAEEKTIVDMLKTCTNVEQANMLRRKYLLGFLLGKMFIYQPDDDTVTRNGDNFFNAKNALVCPAHFLWRAHINADMYLKKKKKKKKIKLNVSTGEEKSETSGEAEQNGNNKQEDCERDLWIFVHPLCLQHVMQIFQNINRSVKIKHVKDICMYELIGPESLPLLLNILKIKNKYTVQDEGELYRFDYERVTLPYDFVIPLYALLPKAIGPFLLNYKVSDNAVKKWKNVQRGDGNGGGAHENGAPNGHDVDVDLVENALDYLRTKNGNPTLKASSFSPYDNNILMNERIKQNVIKSIKVNKYEHVRSQKKKKVKTCILKMLRNNKNIQSYDVLREKRMSGVALGDLFRLDGDAPTPQPRRRKKRRWQPPQSQPQPQQGQGQPPVPTPTHDENAIQSYIENFLHKSENEKKNGEQTKNAQRDKDANAVYAELKKNKLTISQNCKKYIKIPILVINQTCNNNQRYLILCPAKKKSSVLFQLLVRNGSIAIGLKEREKILKCSDFLCYPKDFPDSHGGILYNKFREQLAKNKYFKKPVRKRINYYCLGINSPFNYSWLCIFPYNSHIKIIRATDSYNQFLLKTFLHRFLSISLKRLCVLDTLDGFYSFMDEFKAKFAVFSTYFISVYVHAYREGTPKRLSHVCSLKMEHLVKFFMKHGDTNKMTEWLVHRRTANRTKHGNKVEKVKEPISRRYKSKVMRKSAPPESAKTNAQIYHLAEESDANHGVGKGDEIILASRKIIGYVSSGGHVLSKGRGCGVAHISFFFLLENLLNHAFVLRLLTSDQIKINTQGRAFSFLALIRNIDSVYYSHVWLALITEDKYLPF
ncbi:POP1-like nucleolar ribonuclease [Plasmodium coatneyi]|uniref:POP1-like nucleolar ribonuclease n=1 Tax=Plasmodium coatneyi TaxID=208452 RepID=A0A1B1DT01_9APIC|nr:POP1-like nucleolar ribonuclease [Plasmodium coatneyi]ANQ05872.1 POP1-like nucleolar ribonuclease [Plasmodium coatneyi]